MRVLATAARRMGRRSDTECAYTALIRALRMGGATVEEGMVGTGADLSAYDVVFCEVPDPSKIERSRFESAMWAIGGGTARVVAVYDHWSIGSLHKRLQRERVRRDDACGEHIDTLLAGRVETAVCAFPWGDRIGFQWASWCFDPSMLMTVPMVYRQHLVRERRWVLATYERHAETTALLRRAPWPLEEWGSRAHGRELTTLPRLIQRYQACWGAAIPPYPGLEGSGYWRNRYVHMAQCRSLFLLGQADANVMNGGLFNVSAEAYAAMSDEELSELSERQSDWFFDNVWSVEKMVDETTHTAMGG